MVAQEGLSRWLGTWVRGRWLNLDSVAKSVELATLVERRALILLVSTAGGRPLAFVEMPLSHRDSQSVHQRYNAHAFLNSNSPLSHRSSLFNWKTACFIKDSTGYAY